MEYESIDLIDDAETTKPRRKHRRTKNLEAADVTYSRSEEGKYVCEGCDREYETESAIKGHTTKVIRAFFRALLLFEESSLLSFACLRRAATVEAGSATGAVALGKQAGRTALTARLRCARHAIHASAEARPGLRRSRVAWWFATRVGSVART
jgi:hypothetical protein